MSAPELSPSPSSEDKHVKHDESDVEVDYRNSESTTSPLWKLPFFLGQRRHAGVIKEEDGESFDERPESNRRLGTISAVMLIANRMIGCGALFSAVQLQSLPMSWIYRTGIFANPASIVQSSGGSTGLALFLWLIGALIAGQCIASQMLHFADLVLSGAGLWVYLVGHSIHQLILTLIWECLGICNNNTAFWRRKELPRILLQKAAVPHLLCLCCIRCSFGMVSLVSYFRNSKPDQIH